MIAIGRMHRVQPKKSELVVGSTPGAKSRGARAKKKDVHAARNFGLNARIGWRESTPALLAFQNQNQNQNQSQGQGQSQRWFVVKRQLTISAVIHIR